MLGVLLESRGKRQRRAGGAALSVAAHVAIIAAAAVGTVQGKTTPLEKPKAVVVHLAPPPVPRDLRESRPRTPSPTIPSLPSTIAIRHVDAPTFVPKGLPAIDMTSSIGGDSIVVGGSASAGTSSLGSLYGGESPGESRDWDVRELLMHVVTQGKPRYPESLRNAGVDGRVLVQFSVDTTGRIDPESVKILESTHDLFSRAVRDALGGFRFRPAEVGGRRVAALAQMPFEFHVNR
jgi:protein TonB